MAGFPYPPTCLFAILAEVLREFDGYFMSLRGGKMANRSWSGKTLSGVGIMMAGLMMSAGCIDVSGSLAKQRDDAQAKKDEVEKRVKAAKPLFSEREMRRCELQSLQLQIQKLNEILESEKGAGK